MTYLRACDYKRGPHDISERGYPEATAFANVHPDYMPAGSLKYLIREANSNKVSTFEYFMPIIFKATYIKRAIFWRFFLNNYAQILAGK